MHGKKRVIGKFTITRHIAYMSIVLKMIKRVREYTNISNLNLLFGW